MQQAVLPYQNIIKDTAASLNSNPEWITRYNQYVRTLNQFDTTIKKAKLSFRCSPNLNVYLPLSTAIRITSTAVSFDIRYDGQSVASLQIKGTDVLIKFNTKTNSKCYDGYAQYGDYILSTGAGYVDWHGKEAVAFRSFFASLPPRAKGKNMEHNFESQLLRQFDKPKDKILSNIRPIKLCGKHIQMPTPVTASMAKNGIVKYSGNRGGGIDILARQGIGYGVCLTVIELKDECIGNEKPEDAIRQAIAYATFLRYLLRTPGTDPDIWWKRFGFSHALPEKLKINAVIAMPEGNYNDTAFSGQALRFQDPLNHPEDTIELHYLFFTVDQNTNNITGLAHTSLK